MKENYSHSNSSLPCSFEVISIISRLEQPFCSMAWLMLETGARLAELQALRVRDFEPARLRICVGSELGPRSLNLSSGLGESLNQYVSGILRPAYEQVKRWRARDSRLPVPLFTRQLLFPSWILEGCENNAEDQPVAQDDYVGTLRQAARSAGCHAHMNSNTIRLVAARGWLASGMSIGELHARLGHRDLMTTMMLAEVLQRGKLTFAAAA